MEEEMFCNSCGKAIPDGSAFCNFCGSKIVSEDKPRTCPHCGAEAEKSGDYCGKCGRKLSAPAAPAPGILADGETYRMCPTCGRAITSPDGVCYFCVTASAEPTDVLTPTTETSKPLVAAVLLAISGILGVVQGLTIFGGSATCCAISSLFGALALGGAFVTAQKSGFTYAIAGAICGIVAIGFGLGSVLAIIGLVLIVASKDEFAR
jgi:hypothetical protein